MFGKLLGKILLNEDARKIGEDLRESNITGAEVVGRGTIVVDGKTIASSKEFQELKEQARKIVGARAQA
ncbi:hypothetical protein HJ102_16745 [Vibrio parahaemolyticus]|nr:hypothetical protein [Vibrio parahaemolyticus]